MLPRRHPSGHGGARSRRGAGGSYCSAARCARGDSRAWPQQIAHGVEANEVTGSAVQALTVPACCSRMPLAATSAPRRVVPSSSLKPGAAVRRRHGRRLRRASMAGSASRDCGREESREGLAPGSLSEPISAAHARSNVRERPGGGRYLIYRPPPDAVPSSVHPWGPTRPTPLATRPARRAVQSTCWAQ